MNLSSTLIGKDIERKHARGYWLQEIYKKEGYTVQEYQQKRTLHTTLSIVLVCATAGNSMSTSAFGATPVPGLVAAYSFNEGSGTTVTDASGNNNTGTISGATWNANGKYGKALYFDGINDRVVINASPSLNLSATMTLEAWVISETLQRGVCLLPTFVQQEVPHVAHR